MGPIDLTPSPCDGIHTSVRDAMECPRCGRVLALESYPSGPDDNGFKHLTTWQEACNCDLDEMFPRVAESEQKEAVQTTEIEKEEKVMADTGIQNKIQEATAKLVGESLQSQADGIMKEYPFLKVTIRVEFHQASGVVEAPKGTVQTFTPAGPAGTNGTLQPVKAAPKAKAASAGPVTNWKADKQARRVPNFVIKATGLDTKADIVKKYGENVEFRLAEDGKVQMQQAS